MCRKGNLVVQILIENCKQLTFMEGEVNNPGTKNASLSIRVGSVYGIFIQLKNDEYETFTNQIKDKDYINKDNLPHWKPIKDDYYPLYWGASQELGYRLFEHTKSRKSTYTLQMDAREELRGRKLIYGTILCDKYVHAENELHKKYPDIYNNKKLDEGEQ